MKSNVKYNKSVTGLETHYKTTVIIYYNTLLGH